MILICTNELAGPTGYHKSVSQLANGLHEAGYPVAVLSFLGPADGSDRMLPRWPLDMAVPAFALQTLAAHGGRLLHRNYYPALSGSLGSLRYSFTANQLAALRQLNTTLSSDDTVIFTSPVQSLAFKHAIGSDVRRPRTVLQIHGDYLHHVELWQLLTESRGVIDRLQTVADGLRAQFIPTFDEADVVFIPNFPGENGETIEQVGHDGVNIALPASFQHRKNQLDAVRALALIDDKSVQLTLWGNINRLNPYYVAVQQLINSLGLEERVHLPGFGTESDVYSTADIVLMTSLSEGFPYPLIEAMYQGRPTVAYDFEFGPREAIEDGQSGYIVPLGDVDGLAVRLAELAASEPLRIAFGRHARELFDNRFADKAVAEQYRQLLDSGGIWIDLVDVFAAVGTEPVSVSALSHRFRRVGGRNLHQVIVNSSVELEDLQIDNGERVMTPKVQRLPRATHIEFHAVGDEVISYTTAPGSEDRHYLANTKGPELEVLPYLRRDAGYSGGTPSVGNTIFAASGGAKQLTLGELTRGIATLAKSAPRDVMWKVRQLSASAKSKARPADLGPEEPTTRDLPENATSVSSVIQSIAPAVKQPTRQSGIARAVGLPTATLGSLGGVAIALGKEAATSGFMRMVAKTPAPTRREVARHPWFPITSGVDNFGIPVNTAGGVVVDNAGSVRQPAVSIKGEYDWLVLRDAVSERRIAPPFGYGEMFERICAAERDYGLFDITTADGVHVWELGRAAMIIQIAEALGMWGSAPAIGTPVRDVYDGPKRLSTAPAARRVVFDYSRRGGTDYRTAAFRDGSMFVVQPEPDGYPEVDDVNTTYPLHEFNHWRQSTRRRWVQLREAEVDARPFEEALTNALGIRVDLGSHLRSRLLTFLDQRDFWTPVFDRVKPEEVLISSSHWWAGVSVAAQRAGALVSDIQYADTGRYHPTFWFGDTPRYGATRLYAWSEFWAARTNAYQEHVIVPRQQPELIAAASRDAGEPLWDVCVISQPRVLRRILAFVQELVRERPDLKVVVAPHPAQRPIIPAELAAAGLSEKVTISADDTLTTVQRSAICVGGYSTSLWEAAALNRPVYVIPVPGHELTLPDIESGLFRLAGSPHDLVPYEVPESRRNIFGTA
ncbi:glycosyltransferase [Humibacter sp. RRB41]|uniref:glycosyltransferase n=1 Tax=Humibacter sp. RRB41 TaxID=2919946 RepID=UPI001FAA0405|nr:glycosyltransferase [Humibacter sp. RRB41]